MAYALEIVGLAQRFFSASLESPGYCGLDYIIQIRQLDMN
jgi:hypothetical protein